MGLFDRMRKTPEQYYDEGSNLFSLGRDEEAITSYDKAIALKPDFAFAWNDRGISLGQLGRHEEAVASYDRAIAVKPDLAEAWNNRGVSLAELGRDQEAVASYDRAIALKPDFADAWNNRGVPLAYLGRQQDAVSSFDRAIALKPDFADAWNNRGFSLGQLDRRDEALASYEKAIALEPEYIVAWEGKAYNLKELKRYDEAVAAYERILRIDPRNESALAEKRDLLTKIHSEQQPKKNNENDDRKTLIKRIKDTESFGVLPLPIKESVQQPNALVYPDEVISIINQLDEFLSTARPQINLALSCNQVDLFTWEKEKISLTNKGAAHAKDVALEFSDDFDVRSIKKTVDVLAGETKQVEIAIKAKVKGTIPLDITVTYHDGRGKSFTDAFGLWLDVTENVKIIPKNEVAFAGNIEPHPQIVYNVTGNAQFGDKTQTDIKNEGVILRSKLGSEIPAERKICPRCHQKIHDGIKFCPECGQDLKQ
jgi:tetratricopeptide (TPR) repeat protein